MRELDQTEIIKVSGSWASLNAALKEWGDAFLASSGVMAIAGPEALPAALVTGGIGVVFEVAGVALN